MSSIELRSRVGPDGILQFSVAMGDAAANSDVRVTVESIENGRPSLRTTDEWRRFVQELAGSITDPTFVRGAQPEFERRDALFP